MKINKLHTLSFLLPLLFLLTACGEDGKSTKGPNNEYQCFRTDINLYMVEYPDGVIRKSEYWDCTDSCVLFYWVNDHGTNFRTCDPPPHLI